MKNSDLLVQCLENEGVTHIFGVPGEENLDVLESLRTSSITLITTRNEQTAVFIAANYGRLTGKPGVAIATLGPGATNMVTGVAYAHLGAMPVVVITGQKPIKHSKQGQFQVLDVVAMMKPLTKRATSIVGGERISSTIRQAWKLAELERPGPVHIELPEDIAGESIDGYLPLPHQKIRRPQIDQKMIELLVTKLQLAKRPIILVGAGANRKRITRYLTQFIKQTNIPFFSSQMGKGVVDERLDQNLGTAALTEHDYIHKAIEQADCIIAVGHDTIEKPTHIVGSQHVDLIHINFYPAQTDALYVPHVEVIGDIGNTFWQLCEANVDTSHRDHTSIYEQKKIIDQKLQAQTDHALALKDMTPARCIHDIHALYADDGIVCLDNGLYKVRFARMYKAYHPQSLLLDNALATMGAGYSTAIAAKLFEPQKHVVAVVGDGGIMMNLGDIETIVKLGLDMTIVILNDNAYGMIKRKQHHHGFDDYGLDLQNPDFVKIADAFGAHGYLVTSPEEFSPLLQKCKNSSGLHIIDLRFVYPNDIVD